jgi:predicted Zn-dependent protease with MMP-like domain
MTRARFERLVAEALRDIPRRFRDEMKNVAVIVENEPPPHVLEDLDLGPDDELFGLYEGTPLPERGASYGNVLPDRISIYQLAIERSCAEEARTARGARVPASERRGAGRGAPAAGYEESIRICIAETVIHELGHYFGMSEEEIEEIEENYWRGRAKE